jgi:hypothetical protein
MGSICCNAPTRIGYYNIQLRLDLHDIVGVNVLNAFGSMGTYCTKCNKLCDYTDDNGNEYYTNGILKNEKTSNNTKNIKS